MQPCYAGYSRYINEAAANGHVMSFLSRNLRTLCPASPYTEALRASEVHESYGAFMKELYVSLSLRLFASVVRDGTGFEDSTGDCGGALTLIYDLLIAIITRVVQHATLIPSYEPNNRPISLNLDAPI
ncbi:hypothetical protein D9757_005037 [Collybiopsis confluens]|uniref:Uncharacterized protein n=1 Tax=Collybiopsis confluens TaxID=2823264 RepID=A0A8H5HSU3_9AGAR|nr:hypothetical protein D9757_005037 [Collybiopsis confluens]